MRSDGCLLTDRFCPAANGCAVITCCLLIGLFLYGEFSHDNFAYRVELGPGLFLLAGIGALLLALATVSYQAVRAALCNPVEALRYE